MDEGEEVHPGSEIVASGPGANERSTSNASASTSEPEAPITNEPIVASSSPSKEDFGWQENYGPTVSQAEGVRRQNNPLMQLSKAVMEGPASIPYDLPIAEIPCETTATLTAAAVGEVMPGATNGGVEHAEKVQYQKESLCLILNHSSRSTYLRSKSH